MKESPAGRNTVIAHTASAAGTASLFLIASCIIFLKQKYGLAYFALSLVASIGLIGVVIRHSQWLGTLLSLATGILVGILLVLLYGWAYRHHQLSMAGRVSLVVLPALAAAGFFLIRRAAERIATRYQEIEKKDAVRIIMAGSLGTTAVATASVLILALAAHVV